MTRVVVVLGGNALLRPDEDDTIEVMRSSARFAAERIADIAALGWEVVVTHGNGPQVGRILLQQDAARLSGIHPMPIDVAVAESQGQIGYLLQVAIGDVFYERGMERPVACILTLTRVRADDPAFADPSKPVGPYYGEQEARRIGEEHGWAMAVDAHGGWRRVVPSPEPYSIVEGPVVAGMVADGVIVIAGGGGGMPVIEEGPRLVGVEGVVDKDFAAAILARDVSAKVLLDLTDVPAAFRGFGTSNETPIGRITSEDAAALLAVGEFGVGSMAPKVAAALRFLGTGGERAVIAALADAVDAIEGRVGTQIVPG